MPRYLVCAALAVAVVLAPASAASADPANPDAPYYRAEITGMSPAVPGLTAKVDKAGEWIELSNAGPSTVLVLGYSREPYLRITPTGSDENELSQTSFLNRSFFATLPTADTASHAEPVWKRVSDNGTARWHDHRIHWMGAARPPQVAADPTRPRTVGTWTVYGTADGKPFSIAGDLRWLGRPPDRMSLGRIVIWAVLAAMTVTIGVLAVALARARRRPPAGDDRLVTHDHGKSL
jgi:hypothetical protein